MGVSYTPYLYYGKSFDDRYEVEEYVKRYMSFTDDELEYIEEEGIGELFYNKFRKENIFCTCMDLYSGYGYALGIQLYTNDLIMFQSKLEDASKLWEKYFPPQDAKLHHDVRIS